MTQTN